MALFNNKESEKNTKPQPASSPSVQPLHSAPSTPPTAPSAEAKPSNVASNTNGVAAKVAPLPLNSATTAYLDAGSKISGKLSFETAARIDGQVDGEIHAKDSVTIGESAVVEAKIQADSVVVAGKVSGDIVAVHRIEIRPSAKVLGNITAPTLVIHEGALFEGHCAMAPESYDDRKVTVLPKEERLAQAAGQKPA